MDPRSTIDEILETEEPINLSSPPLMEGCLGDIMRRIEKERKQAERDANIRHNNTFCRKRCKLFKHPKCRCYLKTFEEQRKCELEKKYLELQKDIESAASGN